jgi:hypothetical protein
LIDNYRQDNIDLLSLTVHLKGNPVTGPSMTKGALHRSAETLVKALVQLGEQTGKILSTLSPREEMVLRMRFGIGQKASTLEEISQQFLLPCELLRRIEIQALRKVRERIRAIYPRASFSTGGHPTSISHDRTNY